MLTLEQARDLWQELSAQSFEDEGNLYSAWNVRLDSISKPREERYFRLRVADATGGELGPDWYYSLFELVMEQDDVEVTIQNNGVELS